MAMTDDVTHANPECHHPAKMRFDLAGVVRCAMCGERLPLKVVPSDYPNGVTYQPKDTRHDR